MNSRGPAALLLGAWLSCCVGERARDEAHPDIADYLVTPPGAGHWQPGMMHALLPAYTRLSFADPIAFARPPRDDDFLYVVEDRGRLLRFADDPDVIRATAVFDISASITGPSNGLRAVVFHPHYPRDPRLFSLRVTDVGARRYAIIAGHVVKRSGTTSATREIWRTAIESGDDGGVLVFSTHGDLLVGISGGSAPGRVLRIGIDGRNPHPAAIPTLGPGDSLPFATGLHAPKGASVDRSTGRLWLVDRGNLWDELDELVAGHDYGWPLRDGNDCRGMPTCPSAGLTRPVMVHRRTGGVGIIDGFVYRGRRTPALVGSYVYAEASTGRIFAADVTHPRRVSAPQLIVQTPAQIIALGEDRHGELLAVDGRTHHILRLGPASAEPRVGE